MVFLVYVCISRQAQHNLVEPNITAMSSTIHQKIIQALYTPHGLFYEQEEPTKFATSRITDKSA